MATPEDSGGSQQHVSYSKEANFDTNMVIILAAPLCALGLNLIIRCALRCRRMLVLESSDFNSTSGVKKRALKQIPVALKQIRVLPQCNHGFHFRCIDVWVASHSSCPTCRRSLAEIPAVLVVRSSDGGVEVNVVIQ